MALQEELVATHVVGAYDIAGDLAIVIRYNLLFEAVDKLHWFTVREKGLDFFVLAQFFVLSSITLVSQELPLAILLASLMTSNGVCKHAAAVTSSHFCASERQYRTPLEYGGQRTPTAQRTVTGSGAFILGEGGSVRISEGMAGIVVDKGITDTSNMGAAMAPAAKAAMIVVLAFICFSSLYV